MSLFRGPVEVWISSKLLGVSKPLFKDYSWSSEVLIIAQTAFIPLLLQTEWLIMYWFPTASGSCSQRTQLTESTELWPPVITYPSSWDHISACIIYFSVNETQ